jgi:hypothetical protein
VAIFLRKVLGEGYSVVTEKDKCKHPYIDSKGQARFIIPDIVIKTIGASIPLAPILIDVSVVDPACRTSMKHNSIVIQGAAAAERHKTKAKKYAKVFGTNPEACEIIPLIFETTGLPYLATREFFDDVSKRFAFGTNIGIPKLLTRIASKIMTFNARQFEYGRFTTLESCQPASSLTDDYINGWFWPSQQEVVASSPESDEEAEVGSTPAMVEVTNLPATSQQTNESNDDENPIPASTDSSSPEIAGPKRNEATKPTTKPRKNNRVVAANGNHSMRTRSKVMV